MKALCKTKKRGDISNKTLGYFLVSDPKTRFIYFLKYITNYMMSLADLLVLIASITLKTSAFLDFHIYPFKVLHKRHY